MFSKDALRILQVTRPTLTKYVKTGIIRVHVMPNGHYDYNEEDVYKFLNKKEKRKTYIYARVATPKQKSDLKNQIQQLKQFCLANGYTVNGVFSRIVPVASTSKSGRACSTFWMMSLLGASSVVVPAGQAPRCI